MTLLRSEHAQLAPDFVREASLAIEDYGQRLGPIDTGVIGIVEIQCRDSSYNWASEGIMAFDRGALSGSVQWPRSLTRSHTCGGDRAPMPPGQESAF